MRVQSFEIDVAFLGRGVLANSCEMAVDLPGCAAGQVLRAVMKCPHP